MLIVGRSSRFLLSRLKGRFKLWDWSSISDDELCNIDRGNHGRSDRLGYLLAWWSPVAVLEEFRYRKVMVAGSFIVLILVSFVCVR